MIGILRYNAGNIGSVARSFNRLGIPVCIVNTVAELKAVSGLIVPGAGAAPSAMRSLRERGFVDALKCFDKPFLGLCLGMQILFDRSEEGPTDCLGVIGGSVRELPERVIRPHMGWNRLSTGDYAYFVHRYACCPEATGLTTMTAWYGMPICAGIRLNNFMAVQWHPEKSGAVGDRFLQAFAHLAEEGCSDRFDRQAKPEASEVSEADARGLAIRVIPCLDVARGRVVKGTRFQDLRDAGDPVELARQYCDEGADELIFLDIAASPEDRRPPCELAARVADAVNIPFTVGGGVRGVDDACRLLDAGADKVAVNSAAVKDPSLLERMANELGSANTVCAIDACRKGSGWTVLIRGGREDSGLAAVSWAAEAVRRGAGELLITSHDQDGTGLGFDNELLATIRARTAVPVIASGGAGNLNSFVDAVRLGGASAVLAASVFHFGTLSIRDVKAALKKALYPVRP
jgi:cyclase